MSMEVETIAVIGAGTMGRGIAYASALAGYRTILEDISEARLEQAVAWIEKALDESVSRGKADPANRLAAMKHVATASKVENAIREAELIIEAVPEEMEMKLELFTIFDKFAKAGAVFASNTSSLSITEISEVTVYRERCIGMHFFNPVPKMKLIELIKTPQTSDETIATCREVGRRMNKDVVVVKDSAGFVPSPRGALISHGAFSCLKNDLPPSTNITKAARSRLNPSTR